MATARRNRKATGMNPFLAAVLVVIAIIGALITLEATNTTNLGLKKLWSGGEVRAANMMAVVVSMTPMEPGQRVTPENLWNPAKETYNHRFMDRDLVARREFAASPQDVVGRVLARPKSQSQAFVEGDFLPKGSPSGVSGLIPEGMISLAIKPGRVGGLDLLGFQDRFDFRVIVELDESVRHMAEKVLDKRSYASEADRLKFSSISQGPVQRHLVQEGMVIRPSKGRGGEVVVALHPDDVEGTIDALSSGLDIYCTARTGAPGIKVSRVEHESIDPMADYIWMLESIKEVEMIRGAESERTIVPSGE